MIKLILSILIFCLSYSQGKVWALLESGQAQYLNPYENDWVPITKKEQIPGKTYILTHPQSKLTVFNQTDRINLPDNAYLFIDDLFKNDKSDIVAALVQLDAEQLPLKNKDAKSPRKFGVTYGAPRSINSMSRTQDLERRLISIQYFDEIGKKGTALLSMRRLLIRYPELSFQSDYVLKLLKLYEAVGLDGYIYEESTRFITANQKENVPAEIITLNEQVKQKLKRLN